VSLDEDKIFTARLVEQEVTSILTFTKEYLGTLAFLEREESLEDNQFSLDIL
jgi:hypothetical protein